MRVCSFIAAVLIAAQASSASTSGQDTAVTRRWVEMRLDTKGTQCPFSFTSGGRPSTVLLPKWKSRSESRRLDSNRTQKTLVWTDPATALEVRCVAVEYRDFPAVEWTLHFKNTGAKDTPMLENIQALDTVIQRANRGEFLLHHNVGSPASRSDYAPIETPLGPNATKRITAAGGRPTNSDMSYFNLAWGNRGTIVVVGWPGQWAADFTRDGGRGLRVRAGQELTHFKLHPGEAVRTPLIVLLNWTGDWIDGQNQWRHWMMAHGMPKPGGQLPKPMMLGYSGHIYGEMIGANEANQIMNIDRYLEEKLNIDYWWMDAGWYVQKQGWPQVGTWEVDKTRFPKGFKPISDHAHARGVKTLVWFEPERVAPETWLADTHPEWLLNPLSALELRKSSKLPGNEPCVFFNTSGQSLPLFGIVFEPRGVAFHPGPKGEYSVVRWTAPSKGDYQIDSAFTGIDGQTTTDVHVLHEGKSLFDGLINLEGRGKRVAFNGPVHLEAGENLDFVVGYGNGDYRFDSTGLQATINGPDGKRHDAAQEYGGGRWSYGYLAPGVAPDPATFKAYDTRTREGSNGTQLLDLGNPQAWTWLVEHFDKLLVDNGIDLYRQDFNMDPLSFWRGNDAPDRQGITEIKYVTGYLAYWDELRRRHPNMLIDSCASGGRRN
ncbi:MAG: alpha-galactosidase, partial [Fimbriimonadales bacterium]